MTKLAGNLPTGDRNGLAPIVGALLNDPTNAHLGIVVFSTKSIVTDADTGSREATMRIDRIEVVLDPDDVATIEQIMHRILEGRIGTTLPLDLEDEFDEDMSRIQITMAPHEPDDDDDVVDAEIVDDDQDDAPAAPLSTETLDDFGFDDDEDDA